MTTQIQILYMQVRLVRLASEEWGRSIDEVNEIFRDNDVYHFIEDMWELFHIQGDMAVLDYISARGIKYDNKKGDNAMIFSQEERNKCSFDMVVTLTVQELAKKQNKTPTDWLPEFLASRTARILYDESTKLWWDGPSAIAKMYLEETGGISND